MTRTDQTIWKCNRCGSADAVDVGNPPNGYWWEELCSTCFASDLERWMSRETLEGAS